VEMRFPRTVVRYRMTSHVTIEIIIRKRRMVDVIRVMPTIKMNKRVDVTDILDILILLGSNTHSVSGTEPVCIFRWLGKWNRLL
jgi:hypothetical protein